MLNKWHEMNIIMPIAVLVDNEVNYCAYIELSGGMMVVLAQ